MAIAYTTGTINQPDAGSVGQAMVEKIRDDVVAHAAWDLVEEFTAGAGTVRWYVLKCLAAQSGLPADFFVVIGRTLSNGELRFAICEEYTAAPHTMAKYGLDSSTVVHDSNGCRPETVNLGVNPWAGGAPNPKYQYWIPSGTSTKWWLTVDNDGFTVAFNGPSNAFVHLGAYIPLTPTPIVFPIQIIGYNVTSGYVTRNPAAAGALLPQYALQIDGGGSSPGSAGQPLGFRGDLRYNDKLQDLQRPVSEWGITMASWPGNTDFPQSYGWALGKQKRMRIGGSNVPAGIAFGDAYALGGRLWVPYLPTDTRIWDTGVAAS